MHPEKLTLRWCCRFCLGECEAHWRPTSAARSTLSPTLPQCTPALTTHTRTRTHTEILINMHWFSPTQSLLLFFFTIFICIYRVSWHILVLDWMAILLLIVNILMILNKCRKPFRLVSLTTYHKCHIWRDTCQYFICIRITSALLLIFSSCFFLVMKSNTWWMTQFYKGACVLKWTLLWPPCSVGFAATSTSSSEHLAQLHFSSWCTGTSSASGLCHGSPTSLMNTNTTVLGLRTAGHT